MSTEDELFLMALDELPDGTSRGVTLPAGAGGQEAFLVRRADRVYGYINHCPHTGAPLDWLPDQFLDAGGAYIICAMHGALFEIETGFCVQGPCANRSLESFPVAVDEGRLVVPGSSC